MRDQRTQQLSRMTKRQRRELKERLIASLVCAAYSLEQHTEYRLKGRPKTLGETHDFDAIREDDEGRLAIEITELHGTGSDTGVLDPEKMAFWAELSGEIANALRGQVKGTFEVHVGRGRIPSIPGPKRRPWLETAAEAIRNTALALTKVGERKSLGSPPEIADLEIWKVNDQGSQVDFIGSPITSEPSLVDQTVDAFCGTTLVEKNKGCLAIAKGNGKATILAVVIEYLPSIDRIAELIRNVYLDNEIPNVGRVYLVNLWQGGKDPLLTRIV